MRYLGFLDEVDRERVRPQYHIKDDMFWYGAVAGALIVGLGYLGYTLHNDSMQARRIAQAPFVFPIENDASPPAMLSDGGLVPAIIVPKPKPETPAAHALAARTDAETTRLAGLILPDYKHPKSYETASTSVSAKGERIFRVKVGNEAGKYVLIVVMKPGAQTPTAANASSVQIGALEKVGKSNTWRDVYDLTAGPEGYSASGGAALSHDWNCGFSPTDPTTPSATTAQKVFIQAERITELVEAGQQINFQANPAA